MGWNGINCVITGGAGGIGRCIARRFLRQGASVAVIDIDAVAGQALVNEYGEERVLFFPGDIAEKSALESFARRIARQLGTVDVLVNNACVSRQGLLSGCSYEDFEYVQRVGVTAPFYLTSLLRHSFAPGASVVNIASTRGVQSQPDTESYSAAKGGILALTHAMCASLAGKARVNAVSPGWIDTGSGPVAHTPSDQRQHPVGRVGTPEDIAATVLFLCGEEAGFITGENITVDGGMTRQMVYHDDQGWTYNPTDPGKEDKSR